MFTGIITDIGEVLAVEPRGRGLRRLTVACSYPRKSIAIGASIAHSGVCLTVIDTASRRGRTSYVVEAAAETLKITTAGTWKAGTRLNLERALKLGDELGGHMVAGHVDGVAELIARESLPGTAALKLRAPKDLMRFVAVKGSIALDGISLTVNAVGRDTFSVLIIPHTLAVTTLGSVKRGEKLNLEVDMMARYAARLIETK